MKSNGVKAIAPDHIHYLALEGGGGKGVTYLGAIKEFERRKILPIQRKPSYVASGPIQFGHDQIKGVSGSSAGAITALMLALGLDAGGIEYLLRSQSSSFEGFCDRAAPGAHRIYLNGKYQFTTQIPTDALRRQLDQKLGSIKVSIGAIVAAGLLPYLLSLFKVRLSDFPLSKIVTSQSSVDPGFLRAFVLDGGLFFGASVTTFFEELIVEQLKKFEIPSNGRRSGSTLVTFRAFKETTGVDLRISGTNLYANRSLYFSALHTPEFPVSLAVAISMNIPLLFKPIIIDSTLRNARGKATESYKGLWVDGGLLNNLPIHAFDGAPGHTAQGLDKDLFPLHPNIIALRLMDGYPNGSGDLTGFNWTRWVNLTGAFSQSSMLFQTLMYPSEEGQIRTPHERARTIELFTYDLSMLKFAPSEEESRKPIEEATASVKRYFEETH